MPEPAGAAEPIAFTVIGGFLGAGKTTLLQHWLANQDGLRLAVLVNDFGAINLDAMEVSGSGGDVVALSNGCVCCSIGDDLSQALLRILAMPTRFDGVVVEASGVSDPWRIAQIALAEPRLQLSAVVLMVDAAHISTQAQNPLLADTLSRPLGHADLVVLNKTDLATPQALANAQAWLKAHACEAPVLEVTQAQVAPHWLHQRLYQGHGGLPAWRRHDTQFEAATLQPPGVYDAGRIRQWVRQLPPDTLRLKGLVPTTDGAWLQLSWAGRHGTARPYRGASPPLATTVIAIGLAGHLPLGAIADGLTACRADNDSTF